jgi:hypothetical protein
LKTFNLPETWGQNLKYKLWKSFATSIHLHPLQLPLIQPLPRLGQFPRLSRRFIQKSGVVPKADANRSAVSPLIPRLPATIMETRLPGTPIRRA